MSTLGIIGTAGRRPDDRLLTPSHWRLMRAVGQIMTTVCRVKRVVSGGSAWADHTAVQLYLDGHVKELSLHLPTSLEDLDHDETVCFQPLNQCGSRLNQLHRAFGGEVGTFPLTELRQAVLKGAIVHVNDAGFHARNWDVAQEADILLAFTFGDGPILRDGGTKHTMELFLKRRAHLKLTADMNGAIAPELRAYHYCLNTKALFSL